MTIKYYLIKFCWGLIGVMAFTTLWLNSNKSNESFFYLLASIINAALYPFAHYAVKTIALKFATEDFWNKDFFTSPIGGSLSAVLYVFCFALALPLSIVFLMQKITSSH